MSPMYCVTRRASDSFFDGFFQRLLPVKMWRALEYIQHTLTHFLQADFAGADIVQIR